MVFAEGSRSAVGFKGFAKWGQGQLQGFQGWEEHLVVELAT